MSGLNPLQILMSSETASLKLWLEGTGTFVVPSTGTTVTITVPIPHGFGSDGLIWQVGLNATYEGFSTTQGIITPWATGDGRSRFSSYLDATNLYIVGFAGTAGVATPTTDVTYYYRLLIP